jgi:hypothetical protein
MVENYRNTNEGIKYNEGESIIAKGNFDGEFRDGLGGRESGKFTYTLKIDFKEGRYRITMDSFNMVPDNPDYAAIANTGVLYPFEDQDKYIAYQRELIENVYSGMIAKSALKRLEKPQKVSKDMERQWKYFEVIEPQLIDHFNSTSKSLSNYLNNLKDDDW